MSGKRSGTQSIVSATLIMMVGSLVGKAASFLQNVLLAQRLGTNHLSDAVHYGLQIPDLFYLLLMGGAIQSAITPVLSRAIERDREKDAWKSISIFISVMLVILIAFLFMGVLLSDFLLPLIYAETYAASPATILLAAKASKILFPQVLFMVMAALCIGILNAYKKFSSSAFGPTIYSICVILFVLLLGKPTEDGVLHISAGITASAVVFFLYQLFMSKRELKNFRFSLNVKDPGFRYVFSLAIPIMLSGSVVQVNAILLSGIAGSFGEGVNTSIRYATQIWQLPYGIFAVSVGSVMMPSLSALFAKKDYKASRNLLSGSIRNALFLTVPCAFLFFLLRTEVVNAVFNWSGNFSEENAQVTSSLLMGYSVSLVAHTVVFLYNQAFFAIGRTKISLINGVLSLFLTYGISRFYIFLGMKENGIAFGYSTAAIVSALFLSFVYKKTNKKLAPRLLLPFFARLLFCAAVLALVVVTLDYIPFAPSEKSISLLWLSVKCAFGFGAFFLAARVLGMKELYSFLGKLKGRMKR